MRIFALIAAAIAIFGSVSQMQAQQKFVPAGTLLRCTLDEPHLSPATVDDGDPILCRLSGSQRVERVTFPRGAYLSGHVDAGKKLGSFSTHGSMTLVFDRIGWPDGMVSATSKVIAVKNYTIDHNGRIVGGWRSSPVLTARAGISLASRGDSRSYARFSKVARSQWPRFAPAS
ncbi:MAG TPA: hypothetical protein VG322_07535 [Candidatus Acidoferrales bacterium]|jgi:hypothetical protein|nr:hypothetical protein [Candidatus Acidoferrales bacterium]